MSSQYFVKNLPGFLLLTKVLVSVLVWCEVIFSFFPPEEREIGNRTPCHAASCPIPLPFASTSQGKEESLAASSWGASSGYTGNIAVSAWPRRFTSRHNRPGGCTEETRRWSNFCSSLQLFRMQLHRDFPSPRLHAVHGEPACRVSRLCLDLLSLCLSFLQAVLQRWIQDVPANSSRRWGWKISWRHVPAGFGREDLNCCRNCDTPYHNVTQLHASSCVEDFSTGCEQRWYIPE